jgi:hypothetical protein
MERPAWGRSGRGRRSSSCYCFAMKLIQGKGRLVEGMGGQGRQRLGGGRGGADEVQGRGRSVRLRLRAKAGVVGRLRVGGRGWRTAMRWLRE